MRYSPGMWLAWLLFACSEPAPDAAPSAPAVKARAGGRPRVDKRLDFLSIRADTEPRPARFDAPAPDDLDALVHWSGPDKAWWRQRVCGGDRPTLDALTQVWTGSTLDTRFLVQPWADLVVDCRSPNVCVWATQQPEGRPRVLAHTLAARCATEGAKPWWLDPETPALAVIRRYQPPAAGTPRWRMPYHVRWKRALAERIDQLGKQSWTDPDVAEGLRRLALHPDPEARKAARQLHRKLSRDAPELPEPVLVEDAETCLTDPSLRTASGRGDQQASLRIEHCWTTLVRERRDRALHFAPSMVAVSEHKVESVAEDARHFGAFPTRAKLADDLRGVGLIRTDASVPQGTAWVRPMQVLEGLGYIGDLPKELDRWPRGWAEILPRLASLPGSELADVAFAEGEDGVIQAWADGQHWEVVSLDKQTVVDVEATLGFLNTIARDRGLETRFLRIERSHRVLAAPARALLEAGGRGWLALPAPRTSTPP